MYLNLKRLYAVGLVTFAGFWMVGCGASSAASPLVGTTTTAFTGTPTGSASGTPTVTPTPTPSPTPSNGNVPPPPSGATVISSIQKQQGWQTCGGCGNDGGGGQGPVYNLTQGLTSPSLSGSSTDFWITGGPAFSGGYYFIEQPPVQRPMSYLRYEFDVYVPAQYAAAPQALEFECQQNANGYTYNYAWQADYASNTWRVFNFTTKNWEASGIAFQRFTADAWHHIIALYHASGTQIVHDSLTIDGVTFPANITHDALFTGNGPELTNAFQVDLDGNSTPYHVYVDNMTVTLAD
jgi:hypothetical protein